MPVYGTPSSSLVISYKSSNTTGYTVASDVTTISFPSISTANGDRIITINPGAPDVQLNAGTGSPLSTGVSTSFPNPAGAMVNFQPSVGGCWGMNPSGSFSILQSGFDAGGNLLNLAADFSVTCPNGVTTSGSVRYNSGLALTP